MLTVATALLPLLCPQDPPPSTTTPPELRCAPVLATTPVAGRGDAADDPEVWLHPTDRSRSLLLGTNKKDGLEVYDLDGKRLQVLGSGLRPNNVDVRYDIRLGSRFVDVAVATCRGTEVGLKAWWILPTTGELVEAGPALRVLDGEPPYGLALHRRIADGALFAFVTSKHGTLEQWRLAADANGHLTAQRLRRLQFGEHELEGCVVDDEQERVFVAEEKTALWALPVEPPAGGGDGRVALATAGNAAGEFRPDVEGLALWCGKDGDGYLVASMQGESRYWFFDRKPPHRLVAMLSPLDGPGDLDAPQQTDGLCIGPGPLGPRFPLGMLVCQDGVSPAGHQRFKIFDLRDLGPTLRVTPGFDPRQATGRR